MPSLTPPSANHPGEDERAARPESSDDQRTSSPITPPTAPLLPALIDKWLHERAIRRALLTVLLATLASLVLIAVLGGPVTISLLAGAGTSLACHTWKHTTTPSPEELPGQARWAPVTKPYERGDE